VSPVKYELGVYILEDDILRSYSRENPKSTKPSNLLSRNWNESSQYPTKTAEVGGR
jgi:hypothetical protein